MVILVESAVISNKRKPIVLGQNTETANYILIDRLEELIKKENTKPGDIDELQARDLAKGDSYS